jgi:PiT family inorganic phosphate transporter
MTHWFDTPIGTGSLVLLVLALVIAAGFEFVNGFHDTANAVATVIYTNTLKPVVAVIISGTCNFLGCWVGGIAVALAILKLLPVELLASSGSTGMAMVLALLLSAILWNVGTWYLGLPASSSHTLIGAIIGVGLANSMLPGHVLGSGVNWGKVREIGMTLLLSPVFGVAAAAGLLLLMRAVVKSKRLFSPPEGKAPPPWWIRTLLVGTCGGISFAHGSNDGQKGVGLIMLILIGLLPADFALDPSFKAQQMSDTAAITLIIGGQAHDAFGAKAASVDAGLADVRAAFTGTGSMHDIPAASRFAVRSKILAVDHTLGDLEKASAGTLSKDRLDQLDKSRAQLRLAVDFAPLWVKILIALSLGIGTMIGWKRIVVTVGEKIGKTHLTYAQGASAELVAAATIGMSGWWGLPVSTTHVLSSGIAGTMIAQGSGLQTSTVRNIALAWVLTLPVAMILSGVLFLIFHAII